MITLPRIALMAACACLVLICFLTLGPVNFRPHIFRSSGLDRYAAFALFGFLLSLAYPSRLPPIFVIVVGGAVMLELLQAVRPDRDPRLIDMAMKAAGGVGGIVAAIVVRKLAANSGK